MTRLPTLVLLLSALLLAAAARAEDDLARYRTGGVDSRVSGLPAEIQQGIFTEPDRYLKPLVDALLAGVDDKLLQVKLLHDWLADNIAYDAASYLSGAKVDSAWQQTLRRRQAVCHGYSSLMAEMCSLAGIPCETISGYGRGYGYSQQQTENVAQVNHAWNAVHVGRRWRLVDVTWDAGHVDGRTFRKRYSTGYLFPEPAQFLYTHLPSESKWQLLEKPLSAEQFARLPYLRGRFFEQGLRLVTPLGRINRAAASVQIALEVPDDVLISAHLKAPDGSQPKRRTLIQRDAGKCRILATFPRVGRWKLQLFSKRLDEKGDYLEAAWLQFDAAKASAAVFPETYGFDGGLEGCLFGPLYVPLPSDEPATFRIRVRQSRAVHLVVGRDWRRMPPVPGEADMYQLTATIPRGVPAKITTQASAGGKSHRTLVDFSAPRD